MTVPANIDNLLLSSTGGYQIERSLRFNSADSAYLNRTPASAGNLQTWTLSFWVKRSALAEQRLFSVPDSSGHATLRFSSTDALEWSTFSTSSNGAATTNAVFRDLSAWYHIVFAFNTTLATPADRVILYVNNTRQTLTSSTNPTQNANGSVNGAIAHYIGKQSNASNYFNGYLTEIHFIDGQALTPSSFGETDTITGVWKPKRYSGSGYGTNGFKLTFSDNSGTTSTTLGKDSSGNGNNWTPNNFSVTAGAGNDSMIDTPTPYADGGNGRGNYCTWLPQQGNQTWTFSNGNLDAVNGNTGVAGFSCIGTIAVSTGKWYWEVKCNDAGNTTLRVPGVGIMGSERDVLNASATVRPDVYLSGNGTIDNSAGTALQSGFSNMAAGDIVGVALDAGAKTVQFYRNGSAVGTAQSYTAAFVTPSFYSYNTFDCNANFGQRSFSYTPPAGFLALNTNSLPEPSIKKPSSYMDVVLYTGNGSARSITGLGFSPDLVWIKERSGADNHRLVDAVRGATKELYSSLTNAEGTDATGLTAFNSDGFSLGTSNSYNENGVTHVAWCWDESATPGFDIVTYTGDGTTSANRLIDHSLGVKPDFIITKKRSSGTTDYGWSCWHKNLGGNYGIWLHSPNGRNASMWAGYSNFSATKFTPPDLSYGNETSQTYVNYLWSEVAGFSKFGSYTGNGSSDGPFVFCGFRPRWIMIKNTTGNNWAIVDTARNAYNGMNERLHPNLSQGTNTGAGVVIDALSNGFKCRNADSLENGSGNTIIFAAFAESPFKYSLAR